LEYLANIKVHDPGRAGVLVELSGEFDVSCLEAFGHALKRASSFGRPTFVDLSGVTFMDALCVGELTSRSKAGALTLCRLSWQAELSMAACGLEESIVVPPDDPGYEVVISEICGCKRTRTTGETMALFLHAPRARTSATPQEAGEAVGSAGSGSPLLRES
jgi:anti-anti-sigma regulatory factor